MCLQALENQNFTLVPEDPPEEPLKSSKHGEQEVGPVTTTPNGLDSPRQGLYCPSSSSTPCHSNNLPLPKESLAFFPLFTPRFCFITYVVACRLPSGFPLMGSL